LGWNFYLPNDHQGATETTGQKDGDSVLIARG
jgi:hypothetical protein